jgi:hypothetical protein
MSSHHFVREGQEPALFIAAASSFNTIAPLLEWAPLVMVLDVVLESVLTWGVKIDVVLVAAHDVDKLKAKIFEQMPVRIVVYNKDKDPVLAGLQELAKDQQAVHIVLNPSHETFEKVLEFRKQINVVLLDNDKQWIPVERKFQKWLPSKSILTVKSGQHQPIMFTGLIQHGVDLFETITDGNITIESPDIFWVGETII